MFSICRNCTKLITLGNVLNNSSIRSFSVKRRSYLNYGVKNSALKICYRREFSSSVDSNTAESEVTSDEIDYESIAKGDKELEHKLKVIALEAEVMRQEGKPVPPNSFFTQEHWTELLNLPTRTARRKYFEFLFKICKKKEHRQEKKLEAQQQLEKVRESREKEKEKAKEESIEEFALKYDLLHNNLFLRFFDSTMNQVYNNRLVQAMMFGQKLVIDCGYDADMAKRENTNCAKQIMLLFAENRLHNEPFDLHLCNADPETTLIKQLHKFIPSMYEAAFPLNVHEKSYLDLFPKDQLVYLTPHCREELTVYDHEAIYIVGAIVDKINNQPLSLAKAKREGLRMAKFPLDKYLQWGSGSGKSLTLNQVVAILNDVKATNDWEYALRHVPKRKIVDFSVGKNIVSATDKLRYDRPRQERNWVPSANVNFDAITYNNRRKDNEKEKLVNIKKLLND